MSYRIHSSDRHALVLQLADLHRQIPDEQFDDLLADARKLHHDAEFGSPGLVRNCRRDDPYWFEHGLIKDADQFLAAGTPLKAFTECLSEHNHGHSGFTDQVGRVYRRPTNDIERQLSDELRKMVLRVAQALIKSDPPSMEIGQLSKGWMSMIGIDTCITYLGADVPRNLIRRFAELLTKYGVADPTNSEVQNLEYRFKRRFKKHFNSSTKWESCRV